MLAEPERWTRESGDIEALALDAWLAQAPHQPGVFLIWAAAGDPYLGRTSQIHRRLVRLLGPRENPSRMLHVREQAAKVEYWPTPSWLENTLVHYELARTLFPETFARIVRLPRAAYVKLVTSNQFPRTQITTRLGGPSLFRGPFLTRAAAEDFEKGMLDLFQIRRCQEDLTPSPEHPGCIYGEMHMCLRPCQAAVTTEEYASETARMAEFLSTGGESAVEAARRLRDHSSESMEFEEAARQHARMERAQAVQKLAGNLAANPESLTGIAVARGPALDTVRLWFLADGRWRGFRDVSLAPDPEGKPVSLDARLKELAAAMEQQALPPEGLRQDHLAILLRWHGSSSCDGEWLSYPSGSPPPWRKLVNAISRIWQAANH
jgi:excinuclease UvrABC nuclease subunit